MLVVNGEAVSHLLDNLTLSQLQDYKTSLSNALRLYSANPKSLPARTVVTTGYGSHLFMPAVNPTPGVKVVTGTTEGFQGFSMILEKNGRPRCLLDSGKLTSFRTALATLIALESVVDSSSSPKAISVFGAGPQAYWHVRLTLMTYASIDSVYIWNRTLSSSKVKDLTDKLKSEFPHISVQLMTDPAEQVGNSQIVFGCTPTTDPVIKSEWIPENSNVFIGLIGSYKPTMNEIGAHLVARVDEILVDSTEAVYEEAGEIINNKVDKERLVEIGSILERGNSVLSKIKANGLVVWKCVGLSIMDIAVGDIILVQAAEQKLGTTLDF